jgi:allantoinase
MVVSTPRAIRSRQIVTPQGVVDGVVVLRHGLIEAVLEADEVATSSGVEDAGDLVLSPGLVDSHVHINEPGRTDWEGFTTATMAAAAGGITTLVDMPLNSLPVTTSVEALRTKMEAARGQLHVDCGFYGGLIPGNRDHITPLLDAGVLGIKAFMVDSGIPEFPAVSRDEMSAALRVLGARGMPLLAHAEIEDPGGPDWEAHSYRQYAASRPQAWEEHAVQMLIDLCREHRAPVHIVHLAASNCLPAIRAARAEGLPISVETCPHYLFFDSSRVAEGDTRFKCAPPIRDRENADLLWAALMGGDLDFVVSDHSPSPPGLKELETGDFRKAWGGISSLELGLSVVWSLLEEEGRSRAGRLESLSRWMSHGPSRLLGLHEHRGTIAPGQRADLVLWNPDAHRVVEPSMLHSRHRMTPYEGVTLAGVVRSTFLGGTRVFHEGRFLDQPIGQCLVKNEA